MYFLIAKGIFIFLSISYFICLFFKKFRIYIAKEVFPKTGYADLLEPEDTISDLIESEGVLPTILLICLGIVLHILFYLGILILFIIAALLFPLLLIASSVVLYSFINKKDKDKKEKKPTFDPPKSLDQMLEEVDK